MAKESISYDKAELRAILKSFKAHVDQIKHLLLVDKTKLMSCSDKKELKIF